MNYFVDGAKTLITSYLIAEAVSWALMRLFVKRPSKAGVSLKKYADQQEHRSGNNRNENLSDSLFVPFFWRFERFIGEHSYSIQFAIAYTGGWIGCRVLSAV